MAEPRDGLRLFFALWPGEAQRRALAEVRDGVASTGGRPVPDEQLHLTVLFVGEQERRAVEAAGEQASTLVAPFEMRLEELGFFARLGRLSRTGVVWVGSRGVPQPLRQLNEGLQRRLRRLGVGFDGKRLRPHVTLRRKAGAPPQRELDEPIRWPVEELALVGSRLSRQGASYEVLQRWPLGGG